MVKMLLEAKIDAEIADEVCFHFQIQISRLLKFNQLIGWSDTFTIGLKKKECKHYIRIIKLWL